MVCDVCREELVAVDADEARVPTHITIVCALCDKAFGEEDSDG